MTSSLSYKFDASKLRCLVRIFLVFAITTAAVTSPETKMTCTDLCIREDSVMYGEGEEGGGGRGGEGGGRGGEVGVGRNAKATVTIASAMDPDSFLLTRLSSPSGDIYAGYLGDLVHEISQTSSFRFRWSIVETEVAGENGKYREKWAELTEKLRSEEVNVSVLALTSSIDHNDSLGLTFTRPFLTTTPSLLLKATPPSATPDPRLLPLPLDELLNSSQRRFAVLDETMALKIKSSNSTLYRQLWGGKAPAEVVLTQEEGLRRVREEELVLIMESTNAAYLSATEPCDLTFFALSEPETRYVFAGLGNGSLLSELDRILANLDRQSPDFFGRLYRKWWDRDDCSAGRGRTRDGAYLGFDGDPDSERIFFTSPVKIFKSILKPFDRIPSSRDWFQAAEITESKQVVAQTTEALSSAARASSASKPRGVSTRRRRRTTTSAPPEPPPVASDDRDDVTGDRSPLSGAKFISTGNSSSREVEIHTINPPVLKTRKTTPRRRETGGPAGESRGHDLQNDDLDVPRDEADDSSEPRTFHPTTSKVNDGRNQGQFVNDIDWFFVTQQPRYPQEMDYDALEPDYNDDDDDQKAAYEALDGVAEPGGTATLLVVIETPNSSANRNELLVSEIILLTTFSHSVIKLFGAVR